MQSNVEQVTLNVLREKVSRRISKEEMQPNNFSFDSYTDAISRDLVITLTRRRAAEEVSMLSHRYPRTWFQHLKEDYLPEFLLKRFPVKYRDIHVKATVFYDNISLPGDETEIRITKLKEMGWF